MKITFRTLTPDDYPQVDALMIQVHGLHHENRPDIFDEADHPYSLEAYQELLNNDQVLKIAALADGELAGICILVLRMSENFPFILTKPIAYIDDFVIDARFRRHGVGNQLFTYALDRAKEQGAERLELMVWSFNESAIRFYEKMGLTPQHCVMEKYL